MTLQWDMKFSSNLTMPDFFVAHAVQEPLELMIRMAGCISTRQHIAMS